MDDDRPVRDAVEAIVGGTPGCDVVGCLRNADGLVDAVVRLRPDVVLLDLDMPGRNVIEAVMELTRYRADPARICILSGIAERWAVETALAVGARGYVVKLDGPGAIRAAVRRVFNGEVALSPSAAEFVEGEGGG